MKGTKEVKFMTDLWQRLKNTDRPIVLYGTGDGADKIINVLTEKGIRWDGVFASDGFVRSREFRGKTVISYKEAVETFGENMIILIAFGSSLGSVVERFFELGKRHEVYAPDVPVAGGELFDIDFYNKNLTLINSARELLADDNSRHLYDSIIMAKLTGELKYLSEGITADGKILDMLGADGFEITLDLGAYNGDTALALVDRCPSLKTVIAVEPDERNFKKLCFNTTLTGKVEPHLNAAWDKKEVLTFTRGGGRGIRHRGGEKTVEVMGVPADSLLNGRVPDYIKIDVEGEERRAILGCGESIVKHSPALRIALYHRSADIFELPLMIHTMNPSYTLRLTRTMSFPAWDIDLIATK